MAGRRATEDGRKARRLSNGWTSGQLDAFERDGFLIVEEGFIDDETIERLRKRFDASSPATT
jgi:hypothetical protein